MKPTVPKSMAGAFELIEKGMLKGPWVMGDQCTVSDAYLYTVALWLEGDSVAGKNARRTIRARIDRYDALPPSPRLGIYGAAGNREWQQYFLPDDNATTTPDRCPLHVVGENGEGG